MVSIAGVRTPANEIFTAIVCWLVIAFLWLLVNRTRAGKAVLAASMNPRGVTLLGVDRVEPDAVVVNAQRRLLSGLLDRHAHASRR